MECLSLLAQMESSPHLSFGAPLIESGILKAVHFSPSYTREDLFFLELVLVMALVRLILLQRKEEGEIFQHPGHGLGS